MSEPWSLRPATEHDLGAMAIVHRAAYGLGHFLALLPEATLVEYYRPFLGGGSQGIIVEASEGGAAPAVAGFAVFGANIEPRIGVFKRRHRAAILRTAVSHPILAARKVVLSVLGGTVVTPHEPAPWLLLSIAVVAGRRGAGSALLHAMLHAAEAARQPRLGLYVRHSNLGAVNAYLRAGFRILATIADQYYMEISLPNLPSMGAR